MTWFARQLKSYSKDGTNVTYTYDADGLRGTKTVNGVKSVYKYVGGQLRYENRGGHDIYYYYDSYGYLMAIRYYTTDSDNVIYYAATNAQGDVLALYTGGGILCVTYEYDSWGNLVSMSDTTSVGIGSINPIRYRGYYFDDETGLYYLQSRYYDPQVGRFINADDTAYLGADGTVLGYNVFAYCGNNPIRGYDPEGNINWGTLLNGIAIVAIGFAAIGTVVTVGCAAPLLVTSLAITSGVACIGYGGSEITESVTGYNVIRDGLMNGNETLYYTTRTISETTASITTMFANLSTAIGEANPLTQCFVAGTLVATCMGLTEIENIKVGDKVWSTDPETGETELKTVVQTFINETTELIHIKVNGEEVVCTNEHPFYLPDEGWTSACKLRAGDRLQLLNGEYAIVEYVQHEILEKPVSVYNFEVEDFHTYFVGNSSILVHNLCGGKYTPNQQAVIELSNEYKNGIIETEANILVDFAKEYGLNCHYPKIHPNRSGIWSYTRHIKIANRHIRIIS